MADSEDNPLAQVMEALRAKLEARVQAASEVAARLHDAADRYLRAVKVGVAADVAVQHGLDVKASDESPEAVADVLRATVESLPELQGGRQKAFSQVRDDHGTGTSTAVQPAAALEAPLPSDLAPTSFGELLAKSEPSRPRPERAPSREQADPGVVQLVRDLRGYDLAELSTPMFRVVAEELAARARDLQEREASDPDKKLAHVFRVLTRCAYDRNTTNIFGLNQKHEADWQQKAIEARERRLRLEAGEPDTLRQRLQIPKAIVDQVNDDSDEEEDAEDEEQWELPRLASRASQAGVVLLGGVRKAQKIDKLRRCLPFDVEWVETSPSTTGSTSSLERRIREGHVAAVVILEGLMGHKHFQPVIAAARQADVPVAYAGRAGTGSLKAAFKQIEETLA